MAVYTADPLLDMHILEVRPHVFLVTVEAHIIWIFEQRLLAVRVMAVHAAYARLCRALSAATRSVWWCGRCRSIPNRLSPELQPGGVLLQPLRGRLRTVRLLLHKYCSRIITGRMACQAFAGFSHRCPACAEFLVIKGVRMRAGFPEQFPRWDDSPHSICFLSRRSVDEVQVGLQDGWWGQPPQR
jgi:hypothetical protein